MQQAIRAGASLDELHEATRIDPWFLDQLFLLDEIATDIAAAENLEVETLRHAKRHGFSDKQIAEIRGLHETVVRELRHAFGICGRSTRRSTPAPPSSPPRRRITTPRTTRRPRWRGARSPRS